MTRRNGVKSGRGVRKARVPVWSLEGMIRWVFHDIFSVSELGGFGPVVAAYSEMACRLE